MSQKDQIARDVRTNHEKKIHTMQINYQPTIRVVLECNDETRTEQSHAASCDINKIMAKVHQTGLTNHLNQMNGDYSNLGSTIDYHDALNLIHAADQSFQSLPADLRSQFENSAEQFLGFVQDPENAEEIAKLGLTPVDKPGEAGDTTKIKNGSPDPSSTPETPPGSENTPEGAS